MKFTGRMENTSKKQLNTFLLRHSYSLSRSSNAEKVEKKEDKAW